MTRGGQRINAGRPRAIDKKEFTVRLTISEKDFIEFSRKKLIDLKALQKTLLTYFYNSDMGLMQPHLLILVHFQRMY